jgi:transcriptional regulator with XRE-family HTH domain
VIDAALARTLRRLREERGMTREVVAVEAGLSVGTLARLELGESSPRWTTVRRVAVVLSLSIGDVALAVEATERGTLVRLDGCCFCTHTVR